MSCYLEALTIHSNDFNMDNEGTDCPHYESILNIAEVESLKWILVLEGQSEICVIVVVWSSLSCTTFSFQE